METIGVLEGRGGTEKVEILLDRKESGKIHLRLLCWGEGIGWYPQKTVEIDGAQIGALRSHLQYAEALFKQNRADERKSAAPLLPFASKRSPAGRSEGRPSSFQKTG